MPMLLNVLRDPAASGKEYRMMRARAMECCGLVGMAVGKEVRQRQLGGCFQFLTNNPFPYRSSRPTLSSSRTSWPRYRVRRRPSIFPIQRLTDPTPHLLSPCHRRRRSPNFVPHHNVEQTCGLPESRFCALPPTCHANSASESRPEA